MKRYRLTPPSFSLRRLLRPANEIAADVKLIGAAVLDEPTRSPSPLRVQRRRVGGWRSPPGTIYCGRPGRWGNPLEGDRAAAWFRVWLHNPRALLADVIYCASLRGCRLAVSPSSAFGVHATAAKFLDGIESLGGRPLSCWCSLSRECHVDALIEFANKAPQ